MSEQFETLFKNLANGMSRRAALRRFFGAIAGAAALALTGRRVAADSSDCGKWCQEEYGDRGPGWIAACHEASAKCEEGTCASFTWFSFGDNSGGDLPGGQPGGGRPEAPAYTCVPVG